jgi:hypothetical protein
MNDELERTWTEAALNLKLLSLHSHGDTKEKHSDVEINTFELCLRLHCCCYLHT